MIDGRLSKCESSQGIAVYEYSQINRTIPTNKPDTKPQNAP